MLYVICYMLKLIDKFSRNNLTLSYMHIIYEAFLLLSYLFNLNADYVCWSQEKFRLDISDEQAVEFMQQLINESATAVMPQIVEITHRWAQYWR